MTTPKTRAALFLSAAGFAVLAFAGSASAETLRLLTWGGYAPEDVVAASIEGMNWLSSIIERSIGL